jgi:hypothetical protein
MVFTSPIKTTKQHHNDVFDLLLKDNQLTTSMKNTFKCVKINAKYK